MMESRKNKRNLIIGIILTLIVLILIVVLFYLENNSKNWLERTILIEKENNLIDVWKCEYNGKIVYFFSHGCCDFMNQIYNEEGKHICSIGGITGNGDGKCIDFKVPSENDPKNCKNIFTTHK